MPRSVRSALGQSRPQGVAVVDIGSNSVRLVVFDGAAAAPLPVFNEKAVCALGKGVPLTGHLNPAGVKLAFDALDRFVRLARAMDVSSLDLLTTAAVREASDGPAFAAEIERRFGQKVTVLSGEDESKLAAYGLLCGVPDADGLMGDLGGGSLDLMTLDEGQCSAHASLPLGLLWLAENSGGNINKARAIVARALDDLQWLDNIEGRTVFPVGGAWRSIASIAIDQMAYPLRVLDNFTMDADDCAGLCRLISGLGPKSLAKMPSVSRRRLTTLPLAAVILGSIIRLVKPAEVVFSAYSMREGQFFRRTGIDRSRTDPMLEASAAVGRRSSRFGLAGKQLADWIAPLFAGDPVARMRLRTVACDLSDMAWTENPDVRAKIAFEQVLYLPIPGLTHTDRALLAAAIAYRYSRTANSFGEIRELIDDDGRLWAQRLGAAMRLGYTLSGGVPTTLQAVTLVRTSDALELRLSDEEKSMVAGDVVERRLAHLARLYDLTPRITIC